MTALSEHVAMLEAQVERITREKNSLVNQLEESQHQLASHEMEMNKVGTFIMHIELSFPYFCDLKHGKFFVSAFSSPLVRNV